MHKFKVGDTVIVNSGGKHYVYTKPGSIGKIISFLDEEAVEIEFTKLTGGRIRGSSEIYEINIEDIELYRREIKVYGICEFVTKYYK